VWASALNGNVAVLTYIRRPENVLSFADLAELEWALRRLAEDEQVTVVVLTGGIEGFFVAHADLADVAALVTDQPTGKHGPELWDSTLKMLSTIPQPVIAAVNGQAWGGGCELALACLMRVASAAAHFRFPEVAGGAIPGAGGTQRLPRLIGLPNAARLVLSGEIITATRAKQIGLVDVVLPDDGFLDAVLDWVGPIAAQPRHSVVAAKRAIIDGLALSLDDGLVLEQESFRRILRSTETRSLHEHHPGT
jgi:enoyl-CoA hydratase/carnithine racemase